MRLFIIIILISAVPWNCSGKGAGRTAEIQAADVLKRIDAGENICIDSCIVWGDMDFTALADCNSITPSLRQVYVRSSITFNRCFFMGKVKARSRLSPAVAVHFARNLTFTDCDFRGGTDFSDCIVEGNVFFSGSKFGREADWQGAHFKYRAVYFDKTVFEGDALFQNAVFAGGANFLDASFAGNAMFQKAAAGGLMMFGAAKFGGYADFSYVRAAESIFKYAQLKRYDVSHSNIKIVKDNENTSND
jgi:uncharacterized protein YjbI with pentapeptide repeats